MTQIRTQRFPRTTCPKCWGKIYVDFYGRRVCWGRHGVIKD